MAAALVSALIASYNYGRFVVDAVQSALAQTWPGGMEVIVVDDGSTDDTRERLAPFEDRIRYVYQENQGISAARNTGIRHARGEWIAMLDADDVWHPQKTEVQLGATAGYDNLGLIGSRIELEALPDVLPAAPPVRRLQLRDYLTHTPVAPSSALVRRRCFDEVGVFDVSLRATEDRDMFLRLAARYPTVFVDSPCVLYRIHDNQLSRGGERMYRTYATVLEKFFREQEGYESLRSQAYAYMHLNTAITFMEEGKRRRAAALLVRSLRRLPWVANGERGSTSRRLKLLVRALMGDDLFHRLLGKTTR